MSTKTKTPKRRAPGTIKALAVGLKISRRAVATALQSGMPATLAEAVEWRQKRATGDDSVAELRRQRIALVKENHRRAKIENDLRVGKLIECSKVLQSSLKVFSEARGEFLKMANDIPPRLEGLPAAAIGKIIRAEVVEILTRLSNNCARAELVSEPPIL